MSTDCPISTGIFEGFSWIRCDGKGSFLNSPAMKGFGDARINDGERCLVVDLGGCSGMDSTFMGTLAGMATRLNGQGGALHIFDADSRNRRSLEDLGLDFLMEIDPPVAPWRGKSDEVRQVLSATEVSPAPGQLQRTKHVLEAHQTLSDANERNAKTFSSVVTMLESELNDKKKATDEQKRN